MPDVIVIGGGPAGSTAATMLARCGWSVALFERDRFPREHIGESLLPASMPVFEQLGVLDEIRAAGFLPKYGASMVWGVDREPWAWYFRETNRQYPSSFQVWRADFDKILLDNSRRNGVNVHEEHRVLAVLWEGDRATGVRVAGPDGQEREERARFIVDASGQTGLIGRARGLREADASFQNLAIYAYYEGAERLPEPDETNILIESYENGWFWDIPLHTGWMSSGAVVDHKVGQEGIRAVGAEQFLADQVAATTRTKEMLRHAGVVSGPQVLRDWSYSSTEVSGEGWVLAGDAACFIDPLFSSGVHLALSAGTLAAALVNTALKDPELAAEAKPVYRQLYYQQYSHFRELAKLFYSSNLSTDSYFWEARRILNAEDGGEPRQAFIRAVAGQPPRGYERVVLERGQAPAGFLEELQAFDMARAGRSEAFAGLVRSGEIGERRLRLAADAELRASAVLGNLEFERGYIIRSPVRPEGVPVSKAAASLLALLDGERSVAEAISEMVSGMDRSTGQRLAAAAAGMLQTLYSEGVFEQLSPAGSTR